MDGRENFPLSLSVCERGGAGEEWKECECNDNPNILAESSCVGVWQLVPLSSTFDCISFFVDLWLPLLALLAVALGVVDSTVSARHDSRERKGICVAGVKNYPTVSLLVQGIRVQIKLGYHKSEHMELALYFFPPST
jgi:predicted TIM-barrel enzyme